MGLTSATIMHLYLVLIYVSRYRTPRYFSRDFQASVLLVAVPLLRIILKEATCINEAQPRMWRMHT